MSEKCPFKISNTQGDSSILKKIQRSTFLVVDDFYVMRKVVINQLRKMGAKHIIDVENGLEALKVLKHHPVTMILSDWNMPVMTGFELLKSIRSDHQLRSIPMLMITAEAERKLVEQAIDTGISGIIVKPFTNRFLEERVRNALSWQPSAKQISSTSSSKPIATLPYSPPPLYEPPQTLTTTSDKRTILAVDDAVDNLLLIGELFKDEYHVKVARDGQDALAICDSISPPDLILLDIMMPKMDGFEVAQALRNSPTGEHIPIIFITAVTDQDAQLKCLELGAVDFVTKPIQHQILKMRVKNLMRHLEHQHKLQDEYDDMLEIANLKEQIEHITRHDMKGTLSAIISLAQPNESTDTNTGEQENLLMIEEAAMTLLDMINMSAELYKIEKNQFVLTEANVPLVDIIRKISTHALKSFAHKNVRIELIKSSTKDTAAEAIAKGDATLCYCILQNLLKNACEASPNDSLVKIIIKTTPALTVSIENQGVVPVNIRERFFEKFTTANKIGGTGLGTYSAKLMTEAQGGTIDMTTNDDSNTTRITVTLQHAHA